jgi:hypothetical protein
VRELKRAKPGVWGCIQAREVWSSEEETNMRSGHFWICKLGTFPGSMTCVERKFELQDRKCKWEEYKGNLSGLTFQVWDPSAGSDDTSAPVAMLVKSRRRGTEKSSGCG